MSHGGGDGGGDRWLVSYSDFITLLMVLFVVLYSMGQVDVKKYKQLAESMRAAFNGGAPVKVVDASINQASGQDNNGKPNPIVIPDIPERPPKSEEVAGELTDMLSKYQMGSSVSIQTNVEGVLISLSEKLVFTQGTADLQPEAYPVLDTIIDMIKNVPNQIRIVGHTDDSPPTDSRYHSNWELSTGRSIVIADYLIQKGISPDRVTVSGQGEYHPVFPNDTPEHRGFNSRADIIIIYPVSDNVIQLNNNSNVSPIQNPINGGQH